MKGGFTKNISLKFLKLKDNTSFNKQPLLSSIFFDPENVNLKNLRPLAQSYFFPHYSFWAMQLFNYLSQTMSLLYEEYEQFL